MAEPLKALAQDLATELYGQVQVMRAQLQEAGDRMALVVRERDDAVAALAMVQAPQAPPEPPEQT